MCGLSEQSDDFESAQRTGDAALGPTGCKALSNWNARAVCSPAPPSGNASGPPPTTTPSNGPPWPHVSCAANIRSATARWAASVRSQAFSRSEQGSSAEAVARACKVKQ